jgi:hypothetical protein
MGILTWIFRRDGMGKRELSADCEDADGMGREVVNRIDLKERKEKERGCGWDLTYEHRDTSAGFIGGVKPTKSRRSGIGVLHTSDIFPAPGSIVATRLVGLARTEIVFKIPAVG